MRNEAINYQAAYWLNSKSTEEIWRALGLCSLDIYVGLPDVIALDAAKNFMGLAFQSRIGALHISTEAISVEATHSMTVVEQYLTPFQRAYCILKHEDKSVDDELAFHMAVKAVSNKAGSDELVLTL